MCANDTASCWWYCQSCVCVCVYATLCVWVCICRVSFGVGRFSTYVSVLHNIKDWWWDSPHINTHDTTAQSHTHPCTVCVPIVQHTNIQISLYICTTAAAASNVYTWKHTHAHTYSKYTMMNFSSVVDEHFFFEVTLDVIYKLRNTQKKKEKRKKLIFFCSRKFVLNF